MIVSVKDWKPDVKNTRKGYFTLVIGDFEIRRCVLHKHPAGSIWFSSPGIPVDYNGKPSFEVAFHVSNEETQQYLRDCVTNLLGPEVRNA